MGGFEGFEKRLELQFSGGGGVGGGIGLRGLNFDSIEKILHAVQCSVVSAMGNHYFDSYVLSESSLFIYPTKIIIKTCGTTQLLKSIPPFITYADDHLGFTLCGCRYTRGSFIFPKSQPYPHTSFKEEVFFIEECLPSHVVYNKKAAVIPSCLPSLSWHVFTASSIDHDYNMTSDSYTVEVCMVELDKVLASKFETGGGGDMAGKEMTEVSGIGEINPKSLVSDFAFDPCGYSMNGMDVDRYSTVHVTPEEGYSYASFECNMMSVDHENNIGRVLKSVAQVFGPGTLSVAVTGSSGSREMSTGNMARVLKSVGLKRRSYATEEFPCGGRISFQVFTSYSL